MEEEFDFIVLGTGLTESIVTSAISKAGFKVAHIDPNPYYGADEASLSLNELLNWVDLHSSEEGSSETAISSISRSASVPPRPNQYSISLLPTVIPSIGPLISSLIASGVARYGEYGLLERVALYDGVKLKSVPGSKEDVFKDKTIRLIDKRRLMRFLMFAAGDFEESEELHGNENRPFLNFLKTTFSLSHDSACAVAYALAFCVSEEDPLLPALHRIRSYLKSYGRYGASPFLIGHYGGLGDIAQGFCRMSAVHGGVYILGRSITRISHTEPSSQRTASIRRRYAVELADLPGPLYCDCLISSVELLPDNLRDEAQFVPPPDIDGSSGIRSIARCIAIIDKPILVEASAQQSASPADNPSSDTSLPNDGKKELGSSILIFPPGSTEGGSSSVSVNALVSGPGTMSTPAGKWIIYISMSLVNEIEEPTERLLDPYLKAILSLTSEPTQQPLFTTFYTQHPNVAENLKVSSPTSPSTVIVTPQLQTHIASSSDNAGLTAEAVFWEAVNALKAVREVASESAEDASLPEINEFWPPLDPVEDDESTDNW